MSKIKVMLVDDAVIIRKLLTDTLSSDPEIEVAGAAARGRIAIAKLPLINPDCVILDVEMPEMDGLETLREIRRTHPRLPVIMFSTLTERGASVTLDALSLGASDYVTKPSNVGSVNLALQRAREELIPRIKGFCKKSEAASPTFTRPAASAPAKSASAVSLPKPASDQQVDIVAIGISTGGPNALAEIMPQFPANFPAPIVVVQHMPPVFTRLFAERLSAKTVLKVVEAANGDQLEPGRVYFAPGDFHITLQRSAGGACIVTNQNPPENFCRPAVDVLFRSVAEVYGPGALAVVMTGMGQDGMLGCRAIREKGGQVFVQDELTSVAFGMPGAVAQAGLAEKLLPLSEIPAEILRRVSVGSASFAVR
jgi:two-component system chemotaxis response regulator CheB